MQSHNHNLLKALGGASSCPLHPGKAPMQVRENEDTGTSWFSCKDPRCRFYGDAVSLVAAAKGIAVSEAVRMFRVGGAFAGALKEPLSNTEAEAMAESRETQQRIQVYMAACQLALRKTPDRARFRTGLSHNSIRMVPKEMGLLVKGGDTPAPFKVWDKVKYAGVTHVTYPYTFNGDVTCVKVQDTVDRSMALASVTRTDVGVFMELFDTPPPVLVVAPDPVSAAIIYGNCTAESSLKPPVVAVAGFPLPDSLSGTGCIRILNTPSAPLTLRQALQALACPRPLCGAKTQPQIQVWWSALAPAALTSEHMRRAVSPACDNLTPLDLWAVKEIAHMAETGNVEDVYREISRAGLDDGVREHLLALAQGVSARAVEALSASPQTCMQCLSLGNGRQFWSRERALVAVSHDGAEELLANVGISVSHKLKAYDGTETLVCTVTPSDPQVQAVTLSVSDSHKFRKTAETLQQNIVSAFSSAGAAPYVAVYERNGYAWRDVLACLSNGCEVRHEVEALGADDNHDIHFPSAVIRPGVGAEPQTQIYTLPRHALQMYAGVTSEDTDGVEAYRALFRGCNNLYVAAFAHGLMHVVHQATYSLRTNIYGKARTPRHLLFVETESGVWDPVFRQLAALFSNSDHLPSLGFTDALAVAQSYSMLGSLPLIAHVPALRGTQFPRLIMESPVSLIGLVDSATAIMTGGDLRTTFLTPACDKPEPACTIDAEDVIRLRHGFTQFLRLYIDNVKWDSYRNKSVPSLAAYEAACGILGVEPSPLMAGIAKKYFPSAGMTGVDTFFDTLHRALNNLGRKPLICVVHDDPPADASFTGRGQHVFVMGDRVVISHAVVALLNRDKHSTARFDRTLLTQELEERELLADLPQRLQVDTNRCWVLDRKTWDALVVRPPLLLQRFTPQGSVIQLKQVM